MGTLGSALTGLTLALLCYLGFSPCLASGWIISSDIKTAFFAWLNPFLTIH
jgi:hypothetical protein